MEETKQRKPAVLSGTVPEWATSSAIGQLVGRDARRIQQLTQDGTLETQRPPGGGARKYRTCETVQRFIAYREAKVKESGVSSDLEELKMRKLEAEVALKESQGELHRIKTAIAKGEYIPSERAAKELEDFMTTFRSFALSIPARVAGTAAGYLDTASARAMEKSLREEIETMLTTFLDVAHTATPEQEGGA